MSAFHLRNRETCEHGGLAGSCDECDKRTGR
jgi:hypothetical protein